MLLAHEMIAALPLTVLPSGSCRTGSFSWPLSSFSSGRRPFVNSPNGMPLSKTTFSKSCPDSRRARWVRLHACGGGPPSSMWQTYNVSLSGISHRLGDRGAWGAG